MPLIALITHHDVDSRGWVHYEDNVPKLVTTEHSFPIQFTLGQPRYIAGTNIQLVYVTGIEVKDMGYSLGYADGYTSGQRDMANVDNQIDTTDYSNNIDK